MAKKHEPFLIGSILKNERINAGYTRELVAERANISVRYLTAIENDEKKPRIDVLRNLLWSLGMSADKIFYADKPAEGNEALRLFRLLELCDERDLRIVGALIDALIDKGNEESTK